MIILLAARPLLGLFNFGFFARFVDSFIGVL